jgi:hypothetical protein
MWTRQSRPSTSEIFSPHRLDRDTQCELRMPRGLLVLFLERHSKDLSPVSERYLYWLHFNRLGAAAAASRPRAAGRDVGAIEADRRPFQSRRSPSRRQTHTVFAVAAATQGHRPNPLRPRRCTPVWLSIVTGMSSLLASRTHGSPTLVSTRESRNRPPADDVFDDRNGSGSTSARGQAHRAPASSSGSTGVALRDQRSLGGRCGM